MAISDARAKATAESVMDYIHKATPQTVRDLVTPVGNYTGQAQSPCKVESNVLPVQILETVFRPPAY